MCVYFDQISVYCVSHDGCVMSCDVSCHVLSSAAAIHRYIDISRYSGIAIRYDMRFSYFDMYSRSQTHHTERGLGMRLISPGHVADV